MIPFKVKALWACKKFTNTKQGVLRIRDNTLWKEGIFSDVLGKKLRRNKENS